MKYFAVLDTNVLVSALMASAKAKESNPMKVVKYVFSGKVRPLYNDDILAEMQIPVLIKELSAPQILKIA